MHHELLQLVLVGHHLDLRLLLITVHYKHVRVSPRAQITRDLVHLDGGADLIVHAQFLIMFRVRIICFKLPIFLIRKSSQFIFFPGVTGLNKGSQRGCLFLH